MADFQKQGFVEGDAKTGFRVGARGLGEHSDYLGPVANVEVRNGWLYIETDPHEGSAMLNVEALPKLRLVLQKLEAATR